MKDFLPSHPKIKPDKMKKLFTLCGAIGLAFSATAQTTPLTDIKAAPKAPSNTELERSAHATATTHKQRSCCCIQPELLYRIWRYDYRGQ